jgi:hypothetical protein
MNLSSFSRRVLLGVGLGAALAALAPGCDCTEPEVASTPPGPRGSKRMVARPLSEIHLTNPPTPAQAAPPVPEVKGPPALDLGPLVKEEAKKVFEKLLSAHYDPEALGLRELEYSVEFESKLGKATARGKGEWKSGTPPTMVLTELRRDGKVETEPGSNEAAKQEWTSWQERIHQLLDGLTNGYLSRRIEDWKAKPSKVALKDGKLELSFEDKDNQTTVVIGPGYKVETVNNHYERGISRSMAYTHRVEGGRNLVVKALLHAAVDPGSKLPPRATTVMTAADKTLFEITYDSVGRYLLPVKLHKVIPAQAEEMTLTVRYTAVRP